MSILGTTALGTHSYLGRDLFKILPRSQNVQMGHPDRGSVSSQRNLGSQLRGPLDQLDQSLHLLGKTIFILALVLDESTGQRHSLEDTLVPSKWLTFPGHCMSWKPTAPQWEVLFLVGPAGPKGEDWPTIAMAVMHVLPEHLTLKFTHLL